MSVFRKIHFFKGIGKWGLKKFLITFFNFKGTDEFDEVSQIKVKHKKKLFTMIIFSLIITALRSPMSGILPTTNTQSVAQRLISVKRNYSLELLWG